MAAYRAGLLDPTPPSERSEAHKIAADVLASQHMRADRTVQDLAPLAREFLRLDAENDAFSRLNDAYLEPQARVFSRILCVRLNPPILQSADDWGY